MAYVILQPLPANDAACVTSLPRRIAYILGQTKRSYAQQKDLIDPDAAVDCGLPCYESACRCDSARLRPQSDQLVLSRINAAYYRI